MNRATMYRTVQRASTTLEHDILQYAPLVKRIAYHLIARMPQSVQVEDLMQAGMLGLLEALKHYDAGQGASFETYAGIRIRGAMLDEVRRADWTPRSVYKKARQVAEAIHALESRLGREAQDHEIAAHLQLSLDEYHHILQDTVGCKTFSVEELAESGDGYLDDAPQTHSNPLDELTRERFHAALSQAIAQLPERERLVVALYYDETLNLREIGEVIGVSESRVSQILSQSMLRLRARLADWREGQDNNHH